MLRKASFILALLLGLATVPAYAYSGPTIDTNVPFSFIVEGKVLPAGQYQLMQTNAREDNEWLIQNVKDDSEQALFTVEEKDSINPMADTYVAFKEVNHKEYLSAFWTAGSLQGWHVPVALELAAGSNHSKVRKVKASVERHSAS
jgi:hypothetical protein